MTITFSIAFSSGFNYAGSGELVFNFAVNETRNWRLAITWSFWRAGRRYLIPVRLTPYFSYQPNMKALQGDWDN
ncbi:MAG: hypothetical protein WBP52_04765, partial [Terriglobales bacterium]